jgi:hypothetical protein
MIQARFRPLKHLVIIICLMTSSSLLWAQPIDVLRQQEPIQWAFAPILGTGWYNIDDGRSAFIFRFAPRREIREALLSESGERQIGFYWSFDSAVGLYDIDDLSEIVDRQNIGMVGFTPGIGMEVPVTQRWSVKTFANFGWGTVVDEDVKAFIYYAGVKSRYILNTKSENWAWLTGFYYGGVSPSHAASSDLTSFYTGIEYTQPLKRLSPGGKVMNVFWQVGYGYLDDPSVKGLNTKSSSSIGSTIDFTVALGLQDESFEFGFLKFERLGLTYSTDPNGEFHAISFTVTSWFNK